MQKTLSTYIVSFHRNIYGLFFLLLICFSLSVKAEGSKDLYPKDQVDGSRAFLYCNTNNEHTSSWPFKTTGTHYVYVKVGEVIAAGSSAQGVNLGIIKITSPNGNVSTSVANSKVRGYIADRAAELAGPDNGDGTDASRFKPFEVTADIAGVWRVDFFPPGGTAGDDKHDIPDDLGLEKWKQTDANINVIAAWDVSVRSGMSWLTGRVYTNVLNLLLNGSSFTAKKSYYATHYVLTKDGRAYRVKTNGNNGVGFTFFSNSNGFAINSVPTYKSLNFSDKASILPFTHDPSSPDDINNVTHKIFYNKPSKDLPASARFYLPGNPTFETWLKNKAVLPEIKNIKVVGAEGTIGQVSRKGAYITFTSSTGGTYRITIPVPLPGKDRVIIGVASVGDNSVFWDGKDGNNAYVPPGTPVGQIKTKLQSAEVHFPYIDMEVNPKGIIIELTDNSLEYDLNTTSTDEGVYSDRVYWDDKDITVAGPATGKPIPISNAILGEHSNINGHKWGTYAGDAATNSFGNNRSIDTWAYIQGSEESQAIDMVIKSADLMIESIKPTVTSYYSGKEITYVIRVKNSGPSDVEDARFDFKAPEGFEIKSVNYTLPVGTSIVKNTTASGKEYTSLLNLPNQAVIEFVIVGNVNAVLFNQKLATEASILRPRDVTDPDATDPNSEFPANPYIECYNGTALSDCNNIKYNLIDPQEVCVNTPIRAIDYVLSRGGTNFTIEGTFAPLVHNYNSTSKMSRVSGQFGTAGLYNFTLGTLNSQKETTTAVINTVSLPVISSQPVSVPICEGTDAVFSVSSSATVYQWQYEQSGVWKNFVDGGNISGATTGTLKISAIPITDNGKKIKVIVYSTTGCLTVSDVIVAVVTKRAEQPFIYGKEMLCKGGTVMLTVASDDENFQWYFNGSLIPGATASTYNADKAGKYTVTAANTSGCYSVQSDEHDVTVVEPPSNPTITYDDLTVCAGNTVKLTSSVAANYQWYLGVNQIAGATSQEYIAVTSGSYTVLITNEGGCSKTSSRANVVISALPLVPTIIVDTDKLTFCEGGSVLLTSSSATDNQWYKDGDLIAGADKVSFVATETGVYTVKVKNASGCTSSSASATVAVNQLPTEPTINVDTDKLTFCEGGSVLLTSSSATGNQWYKDGDLIAGADKLTYVATAAGVYTVQVKNVSGCLRSSTSVTVVLNLLPLKPNVTTSATSFCTGNSVQLTASPASTYQWYKGGVLLTDSTTQSIRVYAPGQYSVRVTNASGCESITSDVSVIIENALPLKPTITASATSFCTGNSVQLSSSPASTYQWYKGAALLTDSTTQSIRVYAAGQYTVKVTNASGCESITSDVSVIIENTLPLKPTVIASATSFCAGNSVQLTASPASTYQWYKGGVLLTDSTTQSIRIYVPGQYSVRVTNASGCESVASDVSVVIENALPLKPTVTASATSFCTGNSVQLTASPASTYQWYKGGVLLTDSTTQSIRVYAPGQYTVKVTNASGCESVAADVSVIIENTLPLKPTVTASATSFCTGNSVQLSSSPASTYQWYKGGVLLTDSTTQSIRVYAPGQYTVKVTNASGCESITSDVSVIIENALPLKPTVTASATSFCTGNSVQLTASPASTYQWYKGAALLTDSTTQSIRVYAPGQYTVKVTNASGCESVAADVSVVIENALPLKPTVTASATSFCTGNSVQLTASPASTYQWYKGGVLLTDSTTQSIRVYAPGQYTVKVTNASGCESVAADVSVIIENTLPLKPTVTASATSFCTGNSVQLSSSPASTYQWYKGGVLLTDSTTQSIRVYAPGQYTVKVTNASGCESITSDVSVIIENALPLKPTVTASTTSFCTGNSVQLSSSPASTYQWYKGSVLLTDSTSQSIRVYAPGQYTVKVTNASGCESVAADVSVIIENTLPLKPTVTASATSFCTGNSVQLSSSPASTYQWYKGGVLLTDSTAQSIRVYAQGQYTVKVTNASGCESIISDVSVIIENALPLKPTITASATSFCTGNSVQLTASPASTYQWYKGGVLLTDSTVQSIRVYAPGQYTVKVTNASGCESVAADVSVIIENALPLKPTVTASATSFCTGNSVQLTASPASTYQWYKGGVLLTDSTTQSIRVYAPGQYTVKVTNASGCESVAADVSVIIENALPLKPTVTASATSFCTGNSVQLSSSPASTYQWYKGGVLLTDSTTQSIRVYAPGQYSVRVTNASGCESVASDVSVVIENALPLKPTVTASATSFCTGNSVQLTASPASTYQWYKGAALLTDSTTQSIHVYASGQYTVKVTNVSGCESIASDVSVIIENTLPLKPTVTASATSFCTGNSVQLTASPASTYQWYKGGVLLTDSTTQSIRIYAPGQYTVKVTNASGCESVAADVSVVIENALPLKPTVTASTTSFCTGNFVQLTASPASTYQWYKGAALLTDSTTQSIRVYAPGQYTVKVTNVSGCESIAADVSVVIENALPLKPTVTASATSFCTGNSVQLTASPASTYQWYKGGVLLTDSTTQIIRVYAPGQYTVKVTNASGCESVAADVSVIIENALPLKPTVTASATSFCTGNSVQLTASPASTYQWYKGGVLLTDSTTQSIRIYVPGQYSVRVTNASGCESVAADVSVVIENALPLKPTVTASATSFCTGNSVQLTASPASTYQWYKGGVLLTDSTVQSIRVYAPGQYTVKVTNASGCESVAADVSVIIENALPLKPTVTASATSFCTGNSVQLTASPASTYQWYKGGVLLTDSTTQSIRVYAPGQYTVKVTNASGCESITSDVSVIIENALPLKPTVTASATSFCTGNSVQLTASSANTYQWYKGGVLLTDSTVQSIRVYAPGQYTVKVTNASGCESVAADVSVIIENALPLKPTVTASATSFCTGNSVQLSSSPASTYQWYKGGVLLTDSTTQSIRVYAPGQYSVRVTNASGCESIASDVSVVIENALPLKPTVTASATSFCTGNSVQLSSSPASTYQWYKGGVLLTDSTTKSIRVYAPGQYTVKVTNASGCESVAADVSVIIENALPLKPTVTASATSFCTGNSIQLTASPASTYQWYKGGVLLTDSTTQSIRIYVPGQYSVRVTNASGCESVASDVSVVIENPLPLKPTVTASATSFCAGNSVQLSSSPASTYQWYKGGVLLTDSTTQSIRVYAPGQYTVKVTNASGCESVAADVSVIIENALPLKPTVTASATSFCTGNSVQLTASPASTYQWYKGGVLLTDSTTQSIRVYAPGQYTVKVTNASGCESVAADVSVIIENPLPLKPTVTASATSLCTGNSVQLSSSPASTYQWYKGGVLLTDSTTQSIRVYAQGQYTVKVTNASGCESIISDVSVIIENPLPLKPTVTASATSFCTGNSVQLSSSPASTYQWYKGGVLLTDSTTQSIRVYAPGQYTVKVTNVSGCESIASDVSVIIENALPLKPTIMVDADKLIFCEGSAVVLTSSSNTGNQWYKDGQIISGAIQNTYNATTSGEYTLLVTNTNGCASSLAQSVQVKVVPYPVTPGVSPVGTTTFCDGGRVMLTSSSNVGNQWYKNGILISGAINQMLEVNEIGDYTVKVTNTTGCVSQGSAATKVTVNEVPKGYNDQVNTLSCTQTSFNYDLKANVNNIAKGGNAVAAVFSWTVSSNTAVTGMNNGSGSIINATLINTTAVVQNVVYTVTPIAETGGCAGNSFNITVQVPACVDISIDKVADKTAVSAIGDKIKYTITVHNNGNSNHNQVKVNDPMFGGLLGQPKGDNGNGILEKGESWIYEDLYTITQNDLDNNGMPSIGTGKVINTATVSSVESLSPKSATAEVSIQSNPSVTLVKTGKLDRGFKTITYIFKITNNGNVNLYNLALTDAKFTEAITLKQTTLAPGESTIASLVYTITEPEKIAGTTTNTAKVDGLTKTGIKVNDISGTAENNDDPTIVGIIRYPIAIDDFATTKAEQEVVVPIVNNDRPALFPLNVETVDLKSQPSNGKIIVGKDGRVIYKPNKGFFGTEVFTYKIDDANGLSSNIAQVRIEVAPPPVEIPNTFTPNNDGKNDNFFIKGLENYEGVSLFVYNRWGDEVYRNNNYKNEWDGNGLNDGTYFYVLKLKVGKHEDTRRSWVLIKR